MSRGPYACAVAALLLCGCGDRGPTAPLPSREDKAFSGGAATVFDAASTAFENPLPGLDADQTARFLAGDAAFEAQFVTAPAPVNSGLGPVFNQTSCVGCHRRDGRGRSGFGEASPFIGSALMQVSLPGAGSEHPGAPAPVPGFGLQIGDRAIFGVAPEGRVETSWFEEEGRFADGGTYTLRHPAYELTDTYIDLPAGVLTSVRMAPPVFGRGLLEAVDESEILALADPGDADGDGISGRPNYVFDVQEGRTVLGRFGWKANNPTLPAAGGHRLQGGHGRHHSLLPPGVHGRPAAGRRPRRRSRALPGGPRRRRLLRRHPCRSGAAEPRRPRRAEGGEAVRRRRLRRLPRSHAAYRAARGGRPVEPGHPSLHRPAAARHG